MFWRRYWSCSCQSENVPTRVMAVALGAYSRNTQPPRVLLFRPKYLWALANLEREPSVSAVISFSLLTTSWWRPSMAGANGSSHGSDLRIANFFFMSNLFSSVVSIYKGSQKSGMLQISRCLTVIDEVVVERLSESVLDGGAYLLGVLAVAFEHIEHPLDILVFRAIVEQGGDA